MRYNALNFFTSCAIALYLSWQARAGMLETWSVANIMMKIKSKHINAHLHTAPIKLARRQSLRGRVGGVLLMLFCHLGPKFITFTMKA
jgi:hypothetical protein